VGQGKNYAGKLAIRFAYATNGQGIYAVDMQTGEERRLTGTAALCEHVAMTTVAVTDAALAEHEKDPASAVSWASVKREAGLA